jgi:hypothetical protein
MDLFSFVILDTFGIQNHSKFFSIKSGELKPLKLNKLRFIKLHGKLYFINDPNFCISVKGRNILLSKYNLNSGRFVDDKQEIQICSLT